MHNYFDLVFVDLTIVQKGKIKKLVNNSKHKKVSVRSFFGIDLNRPMMEYYDISDRTCMVRFLNTTEYEFMSIRDEILTKVLSNKFKVVEDNQNLAYIMYARKED